MTQKEINDRLHKYIVKETILDPDQIKNNTLLFEEGIFSSMGLLLLIEFIKEEFNIDTKDDELLLENFESIESMSKFIIKKR